MNSIEKKKIPPVIITEQEGKKGEEKGKGPITYLDKGGSSSPKSKINLTQLILAVGLSIVVFLLLSQFMLTSKQDALTLLDNQKLLEGKITTVEGKLGTETGRIENIIAAQANFVTESDLEGLARQSELASLSNSIGNIGNQIESLESTVGAHEERLVELEGAINGTVVVGGGSSYCYLTKQIEGYGLTALSSRTGFYLAQVTLVLDTPTELLSIVGTGRDFVENMGFVGGTWRTISITFYTGEFKLNAGEIEDDLEIPLNLSLEVEYIGYEAHVELLPSAVTSTGGGNVI